MNGSGILELRSKEDALTCEGRIVRAFGTYVAQDTQPYPNIRRESDGTITRTYVVGVLVLKDKTQIILGIRTADELATYDRKVVAVVGRFEAALPLVPGMAQPMPRAWLREIQSIELCSE